MKQNHPHSKENTPEENEYYETRTPYLKIYRLLRRGYLGIEVFAPDGNSEGVPGYLCLKSLLMYFDLEKDTERSAYIRECIKSYSERWPEQCNIDSDAYKGTDFEGVSNAVLMYDKLKHIPPSNTQDSL